MVDTKDMADINEILDIYDRADRFIAAPLAGHINREEKRSTDPDTSM